jgi:hypothetical protein
MSVIDIPLTLTSRSFAYTVSSRYGFSGPTLMLFEDGDQVAFEDGSEIVFGSYVGFLLPDRSYSFLVGERGGFFVIQIVAWTAELTARFGDADDMAFGAVRAGIGLNDRSFGWTLRSS